MNIKKKNLEDKTSTKKFIGKTPPLGGWGVVLIVLIALLVWYFASDPTQKFTSSDPGMDNRGKGNLITEIINIGEHFQLFKEDKESKLDESWPRFRGPNFDNISSSKIKLANSFSNGAGDILWSHELGEGHAGPAIYEGKIYLLNYDEELRADMLHCYDLVTGEELWRRWYNVAIKRNHGMSRTVPAVNEDFILSMGPRCHVMCLNRESGDFLWGIDLEKEYETETPLWYTGQCPLIDNNTAIIAPGGKALMIAVDCKTGDKLWEVPNPDGWKMSHSSILPYTFNGQRMYVYCSIGGIIAVSPDGELLWKTSDWDTNVIAPSALCMPDGKIFLTAGYGAGSMVLQLSETNGSYSTKILQEYKPKDGLACEQQTPIYWEGHLFGIMPKDGGLNRNKFVCVNPNDCTNILWTSDKESRFGLGPYIWADGKFYLLNDDGTLHIIEASTKGYKHLDSKVIIEDGHDAWAPLALANGYLVLRDADKMVCINIKR
ncbi:MAG: PQQ-binding-like beta-propeller repeat protein [Prolixibacteraceae bacterium]|jgi:outer membrane protein assembly factor BamB|nr:PQQ-binding-like beta-propeller repeat protein [Prolixibacteraceae bacterium]